MKKLITNQFEKKIIFHPHLCDTFSLQTDPSHYPSANPLMGQ